MRRSRPLTPPPIADEDATAEGPLALFHARLTAGELAPDPRQARAAERLQQLWDELQDYHPHPGGGFLAASVSAKPPPLPPKGLYIHGRVGRGKSMLMDAFFSTVPGEKKRRVHFFAFMADVHARIQHAAPRKAIRSCRSRRISPARPMCSVLRRIPCRRYRRCDDFGPALCGAFRRRCRRGRDLEPCARQAL